MSFVLIAACGGGPPTKPPPVVVAPPPAVLVPPPAAEPARTIFGAPRIGDCPSRDDGVARFTLLHVNDMQAHYSDRIDGRSRYARLAGAIRDVRATTPATLVLDAGDDYEKGSLLDLRTAGEATRRVLHAMPIDARVLGNHDFAYGPALVREDVRKSPHPVLLANVRDPEDAKLFQPYAAFEVGCVKVGVFGLVTRPYGSDDEQFDGPYGPFIVDPRVVAAAKRTVRQHRAEVDVMIALTHLGKGTDTFLAREVAGVDLVVGGHSEDAVSRPIRIARLDGTEAHVLQAGRFAENLGRASLSYDRASKRVTFERYALVPVDAAMPVDEVVDELVKGLEAQAVPTLFEPFTHTSRELGTDELARLTFEAVRREAKADALLVGKDAFWGKLPEGPITRQALYQRVPVQKQPVATAGFTSLWMVELSAEAYRRLRTRFRRGSSYAWLEAPGPSPPIVRLALDKRLLEHPALLTRPAMTWAEARPIGELIDVLERFGVAQAARGEAFDAPL